MMYCPGADKPAVSDNSAPRQTSSSPNALASAKTRSSTATSSVGGRGISKTIGVFDACRRTKGMAAEPRSPPAMHPATSLLPVNPSLIRTLVWLRPATRAHTTPPITVDSIHGTPAMVRLATTAIITRTEANLAASNRSEEHTSELQSRPHLVCRLLLEKK